MLLAVDVGNTNIVIGVFSKSQLITSWRLATDSRRSADEYGILVEQMFRHEGIDPSDIDECDYIHCRAFAAFCLTAHVL